MAKIMAAAAEKKMRGGVKHLAGRNMKMATGGGVMKAKLAKAWRIGGGANEIASINNQ
jgi:hypothetical protein